LVENRNFSFPCHSVIRKVNEMGLKTDYETNDEIHSYLRCLPALAFVPPDDVQEAFELLAESQPTTVDHLDELTSFFEHTSAAADDEDAQRLTVQPHSPSQPGIRTLQGPTV